ncbi:MAG: ribonuclease PH [Acidobacteriota bacterium]|nr:ribonuclease PH [Acidobacteriota bacterium]
MSRRGGRGEREIRDLWFQAGYLRRAPGSVLVRQGDTRVVAAVSVEEGVPGWLRGRGRGWLTAEYGMLPLSSGERIRRDRGGVPGRTAEIQRLIGRSLRAAVDLSALGERTVRVDCDVIEADGGTRTASITGAFVALALALHRLQTRGVLAENPLRRQLAAVSVGVVDGRVLLDLDYSEDSRAAVDLTVVATATGELIEVQGAAEAAPFRREVLDELLDAALEGIAVIAARQRSVLAGVPLA